MGRVFRGPSCGAEVLNLLPNRRDRFRLAAEAHARQMAADVQDTGDPGRPGQREVFFDRFCRSILIGFFGGIGPEIVHVGRFLAQSGPGGAWERPRPGPRSIYTDFQAGRTISSKGIP